MSLKAGDDDEDRPLSKKLKSGDDKMDWGGPMDDEETARRKLEEEDFDPDASVDDYGDGQSFTPMLRFCYDGDIKMVRHLLSKGASVTKGSRSDYFFPMFAAAHQGNLDLCKLLLVSGAGKDIRRVNKIGWSPVTKAANKGNDKLVRWLVLHGALSDDSNSNIIQGDRIYIKHPHYESYREQGRYTAENYSTVLLSFGRLVEWAEDVTRSHSSLIMFLLGTLPPPKAPDAKGQTALQSLDGHPGSRKHIGEFVGQEVKKKKHLRILRQVKEVLPSFLQEEEEEEEED